jgi:hypothetical protein
MFFHACVPTGAACKQSLMRSWRTSASQVIDPEKTLTGPLALVQFD